MNLNWQWKLFNELTASELYTILELRSAVFIVEQQEIYQDIDNRDLSAWHLCGYSTNNELIAYARLIFPNENGQPITFGRVIVAAEFRGKGFAKVLVQHILDKIQHSEFKDCPIEISAQAHLENFYGSFGFRPADNPYLDGGILHIHMVR